MSQLIAKQLVKILEENGFVFIRQNGSHLIFKDFKNNITLPVPIHDKNNPIYKGTLSSIIKQSKLPKEKFFKK